MQYTLIVFLLLTVATVSFCITGTLDFSVTILCWFSKGSITDNVQRLL